MIQDQGKSYTLRLELKSNTYYLIKNNPILCN